MCDTVWLLNPSDGHMTSLLTQRRLSVAAVELTEEVQLRVYDSR